MTEYELLIKILEEIIDKAGSYNTQDLIDIWEAVSGEQWEICGDEIIKSHDSYYDD